MMLIATTAVFALVASTAFAAPTTTTASTTASMPAIIVNVSIAGADVSPALVTLALAEAEKIWRPTGVRFLWQRLARSAASADAGPYTPNTLHLIIGNDRGVGRGGRRPLGWIVFDDVNAPQREIYLSHANAQEMMQDARGIVGIIEQMPLVQRDVLLARAMGRALAHEMGHYLFASKVHTERGLMKAVMTATELFTTDTIALRIDAAQRATVVARLSGQAVIASR
jgi:hypothetical protein